MYFTLFWKAFLQDPLQNLLVTNWASYPHIIYYIETETYRKSTTLASIKFTYGDIYMVLIMAGHHHTRGAGKIPFWKRRISNFKFRNRENLNNSEAISDVGFYSSFYGSLLFAHGGSQTQKLDPQKFINSYARRFKLSIYTVWSDEFRNLFFSLWKPLCETLMKSQLTDQSITYTRKSSVHSF